MMWKTSKLLHLQPQLAYGEAFLLKEFSFELASFDVCFNYFKTMTFENFALELN